LLNHEYYVWVEITANKKRILDCECFAAMLDKCVQAGIGSMILSVKDTSGFCLYDSKFVPHYADFDADFDRIDYLQEYLQQAHERGMKLYAGIDVFAEGSTKRKNLLSPGFAHPSWQTEVYGLDETGAGKIQRVADAAPIRTTGSIDDFNEVFVNPVMEEVQEYEISIIQELIGKYDIDGIVLDRARFVGLSSDFSKDTREKFEGFAQEKIEHWPEDIYCLTADESGLKIEYGAVFGKWVEFRAKVIKDFILKVRKTIDNADKKLAFMDYTGSWYPLYYMVGANWASERYVPEEYPWVNAQEYAKTGYAESLDRLLSGFYYNEVTRLEAESNQKPYWYSVEGSGDMVEKVLYHQSELIGKAMLS
jgi:uncharacterized lipoprotein YddW (UPF0748 family)